MCILGLPYIYTHAGVLYVNIMSVHWVSPFDHHVPTGDSTGGTVLHLVVHAAPPPHLSATALAKQVVDEPVQDQLQGPSDGHRVLQF